MSALSRMKKAFDNFSGRCRAPEMSNISSMLSYDAKRSFCDRINLIRETYGDNIVPLNDSPNSADSVKEYLMALKDCPGMNTDTSTLARMELAATNIASSQELKYATDMLNCISEYCEDKPNAYQMAGRVVSGLRLNETDFMAVAKLVPFEDSYASSHLISNMTLYNDDYSTVITDESVIQRVRDNFNRFHEVCHGRTDIDKGYWIMAERKGSISRVSEADKLSQSIDTTDKSTSDGFNFE